MSGMPYTRPASQQTDLVFVGLDLEARATVPVGHLDVGKPLCSISTALHRARSNLAFR